ncbi:hypothetical protein T459_13687 [Capsicum annuum]|uniref:Zeatin O-glucosyltransferase-like n=1 Tax=Capsicum annuum TaxID=4072 RepID=A0A2G2ZF99_CAPAN|nr:hypothetical protein T459_13687 [Capsicum annuum]
MGVPIAAWPMHGDQPRNGFLVTEVLKIGLIVREWEKREELKSITMGVPIAAEMLKIGLIVREWQKREELVSASTIENVVRKLMASERMS